MSIGVTVSRRVPARSCQESRRCPDCQRWLDYNRAADTYGCSHCGVDYTPAELRAEAVWKAPTLREKIEALREGDV